MGNNCVEKLHHVTSCYSSESNAIQAASPLYYPENRTFMATFESLSCVRHNCKLTVPKRQRRFRESISSARTRFCCASSYAPNESVSKSWLVGAIRENKIRLSPTSLRRVSAAFFLLKYNYTWFIDSILVPATVCVIASIASVSHAALPRGFSSNASAKFSIASSISLQISSK